MVVAANFLLDAERTLRAGRDALSRGESAQGSGGGIAGRRCSVPREGSEGMRRIAAPMVGGRISLTVLTLLVIPAIPLLVKQRNLLVGARREMQ